MCDYWAPYKLQVGATTQGKQCCLGVSRVLVFVHHGKDSTKPTEANSSPVQTWQSSASQHDGFGRRGGTVSFDITGWLDG